MTTAAHEHGIATRAVWSGRERCAATGATIAPIYQSVTYTLPKVGAPVEFDYSRTKNPTRSFVERQLAALEDAEFACAFGSGMAAVAGALSLLSSGNHLLATRDIYGGTHRLFTQVLPRYGITTTFVDTANVAATLAAVTPQTRMLWLETPSNPRLRLCDIAALARSKPRGVLVAVDNTFASPCLQRPLNLGADIVVHSTTKYICGHSDALGGAVLGNDAEIAAAIAFHQNCVGAVPGPFDSYLTLRGAKTLPLRMEAHCRNAQRIADFLAQRDDVAEVCYPGLTSHPQHELGKRQMRAFGGVVSFRPRGGAERAHAIADTTRIFNLAVSLGGVESLICLPARMTHASLTDGERAELGINDDLLRLSVGIEDVDDLIADLQQALERTTTRSAHANGQNGHDVLTRTV